ncbi:hypothetical protein HPB50_029004 [Hyalomma asiaticum]|nr:hypothetical protein HPB50_029004 [Hyalomma asiaticum]
MFYVHHILHRRKGKFGLLWLAATSPKSVRHVKLMSISLAELSEELEKELAHGICGRQSLRLSLRLSCRLIMGLWALYRRKAALTRAKAEQCLRKLIRRRQLKPRDIDLPTPKRRRGVTLETNKRDDFGEVTEPLALPELPTGDEAPEMPPRLTVDVDTITLREEVPTVWPEQLEEEMIPFEASGYHPRLCSCVLIATYASMFYVPYLQVDDGGDFLGDIERIMAAQQDKKQAAAPTVAAASPRAEAGEPPARPISPIPRIRSETPPLPRRTPRGTPSPRLGEPAAEAEPGAVEPPELPTGAEPAPRTAEEELAAAAPVVPGAEPPAPAASPTAQLDVDAAAAAPQEPGPASPLPPRRS